MSFAHLTLVILMMGAEARLTPDQMDNLGADAFGSAPTQAPPPEPPTLTGRFSEADCKAMFETKTKLGGPVPPNDFVEGCTQVCGMVRDMKDYWKTGEHAAFACAQGAKYGCVWDG